MLAQPLLPHHYKGSGSRSVCWTRRAEALGSAGRPAGVRLEHSQPLPVGQQAVQQLEC